MKKIFFRVTNTSDNDAWKKARQTISHHVTPPTMKILVILLLFASNFLLLKFHMYLPYSAQLYSIFRPFGNMGH